MCFSSREIKSSGKAKRTDEAEVIPLYINKPLCGDMQLCMSLLLKPSLFNAFVVIHTIHPKQ